MHRIGILISGRGSNMLTLIDAVRDRRIPGGEVALVISDQSNAVGLELARKRGVEAVAIERQGRERVEHEREIIAALDKSGVTLLCLAGFMRLLTPHFIQAFGGPILNIHPSLLPSFPGLHAPRQAIEYGVRVSGCTVHFVDETLDGGAILEQRVVSVEDDDTEETLAARILVEEHGAYPEALARVVRGDYRINGRRVERGSRVRKSYDD